MKQPNRPARARAQEHSDEAAVEMSPSRTTINRSSRQPASTSTSRRRRLRNIHWSLSPFPLLWMTAGVLLSDISIYSSSGSSSSFFALAHPPPPQANDIFGTVNGCSSALIEMDDNQDGRISKGEYLDFVNLLADFLCVPPRPIVDLEIQTVFFSISCLCQEREGFDVECCFGSDAAIFNKGAADAITRTEDEDSYLRAACLLTQAILGPQQCKIVPRTLSPGAVTVAIARLRNANTDDGLSDEATGWIIAGAVLLALLCCILVFCACTRRKNEEEEEMEETIIKDETFKSMPLPILEPLDVEEVSPNPSPVPMDTYEEEAPAGFPPGHKSYEPKELAPAFTPVMAPILRSMPPADEESVEENDNVGRKSGGDLDDDEDDEYKRKFGGQGMLPQTPEPEGVRLRHIEVEKGSPDEYEYPEREFSEHKFKREDSGQLLPHEEIDSGVHNPQRPVKLPVVFIHPKYNRPVAPEPEPYDPRKFRNQLAMGDGEVWGALATYEDHRKKSKENRFEWIVQGALDVLAKANDSGELIKPRPARAGSPQRMRPSPTPPPQAPPGQSYNGVDR